MRQLSNYDQWYIENCRDLDDVEVCALQLRLYADGRMPLEPCTFTLHCWFSARLASLELATGLLSDYRAEPRFRRRAALQVLAHRLGVPNWRFRIAFLKPLLIGGENPAEDDEDILRLVRLVLRKQNWWSSLREEIRQTLQSLSKKWLDREVDLTTARAQSCLNLSDEIVGGMKTAGAWECRFVPCVDLVQGGTRETAGLEQSAFQSCLKAIHSGYLEDSIDGDYPAWLQQNFRGAGSIEIAAAHLERLLEEEPVGEQDGFVYVCIWWIMAAGVELACKELERVEQFPNYSDMAASYLLAVSIGSECDLVHEESVRAVFQSSEYRFDTLDQLRVARYILLDRGLWRSLGDSVRRLLEKVSYAERREYIFLDSCSRPGCLAVCERLMQRC